MNNIYELPNRTGLIEEASDWLVKIERGLTGQEDKALQDWLAVNPEHLSALMEVASVWDRSNSLSRLADLFPQTVDKQSKSSRLILTTVVIALLAVLAGFWNAFNLTPQALELASVFTDWSGKQVYQTEVGEHSTVNLSDGSQLTLNTSSLIRVSFTKTRRLVVLERGEIYVHVAHDEARPLSVQIGDKVVKAVGTAFNIKITKDHRVEVIVMEGRVLVGMVDQDLAIPIKKTTYPSPTSGSPKAVSAGEKIMLGDGDAGGEVRQVQAEEVEVKLSWRGGNLVFHGESLEVALTEIERYTPMEFIILDEDLKKLRVVGMFKAGDVDGLLATLRENFDIAYERISKEKVILTNK